MVYIGMDVHQKSTTFCIFDPSKERAERYRTLKRTTDQEAFDEVLGPFRRRCKVTFEVGTQAQWVASIVRPLAVEVQVANPSRIPWLFRDGRKNDRRPGHGQPARIDCGVHGPIIGHPVAVRESTSASRCSGATGKL